MTVEEMVWNELVQRTEFCSAKTIAKKLSISRSYVRQLLARQYKRGVLDKVIRDKTNLYRIKQ